MPAALWGDHLCREKGYKVGAGKPESISTAMYALCLSILSKMADLLGYNEDAEKYSAEAEAVTGAFVEKFIAADGTVDKECHIAAAAFALYSMEFPPRTANAVLQTMLKKLAENNRIVTGLLGTTCLIQVLDRFGKFDEIWKLLHRGGDPGYASMLAGGMSSIPEIWESQIPGNLPRSLSHVPLGAVSVWFYRRLAGIANASDSAGFKKVEMRPYFPTGLNRVDASVITVAGKIVSNWRRDGKRILWEISLPAGILAEVVFPETFQMASQTICGGQYLFEF